MKNHLNKNTENKNRQRVQDTIFRFLNIAFASAIRAYPHLSPKEIAVTSVELTEAMLNTYAKFIRGENLRDEVSTAVPAPLESPLHPTS